MKQIDKEDKEGSHEAAMFGAKTLVTTPVGDVSQVKNPPLIAVSQANDKEGLFASWVRKQSIRVITQIRNYFAVQGCHYRQVLQDLGFSFKKKVVLKA